MIESGISLAAFRRQEGAIHGLIIKHDSNTTL